MPFLIERRAMFTNLALWVLLAGSPAGSDGDVDAILAKAWREAGIEPAPLCSDDEFLRRVSLDLIGRIPTRDELHRFRQNSDRRLVIDQLLAGDEFPRFWSEVWTATWHGYSVQLGSDREVMRGWLETAFRSDVPYDQLVERMLTATGSSAFDGPTNFLVRHQEEPAVRVCRLFLGVRLDCARCHDHPFDRWTQQDFELMSRFFQSVDRQEVSAGNIRIVSLPHSVSSDDERPQFLTGARPRTRQWRNELSLFVVRSKPFARTYANRMWYHFFARGIVDPVDDFNRENPPSVPELMAFLSDQAREMQFQIRPMIRLICNSQAYQRKSEHRATSDRHIELFATRLVKPMTAEQVFDSRAIAVGTRPTDGQRLEFIRQAVGDSLEEDFSTTWDYRETVQQVIQRLSEQLPVPSMSVTELYERILSRPPTPAEQARCAGQTPEDIVFALVNSNDFFFNH